VTPYKHAESSAKKFGGSPADYIAVHNWFDETKQYTGDWTHRALRHHAAGVQWCVSVFGDCVRNSAGREIPTRQIAEQHVEEDCGFIPTVADWLGLLRKSPEQWMLRVARKSNSEPLTIE
jgi:hypothetical protein